MSDTKKDQSAATEPESGLKTNNSEQVDRLVKILKEEICINPLDCVDPAMLDAGIENAAQRIVTEKEFWQPLPSPPQTEKE